MRRRGGVRRSWRAIGALFATGAMLVLGAAIFIAVRPHDRARAMAGLRSLPLRVRLAHASLERDQPRRPALLRCAPARTTGAPGELLSIHDVPGDATASALFVWPAAREAAAAAELRALRALAGSDALRELPGRPRAAVLTARGGLLRAAPRVTPSATVQLAVSGTRELCVVAG